MTVKFIVPGAPQGKGRHRTTKTGHTYTPAQTVHYENLVVAEYRRQCGTARFADDQMLDMRIIAYFPIPKSASKARRWAMQWGVIRPIIKPDADNIIKIVADALNLVAYKDDSRIVDCQHRKFYSNRPRVEVTIRDVKTKGEHHEQESIRTDA